MNYLKPVFANLIEAIKAVRSLPVMLEQAIDTATGNVIENQYKVKLAIGLREAKDLVEAIMAIQPQTWVVDDLKARLKTSEQVCDNLKTQVEQHIKDYENLDRKYWSIRRNLQDVLDK